MVGLSCDADYGLAWPGLDVVDNAVPNNGLRLVSIPLRPQSPTHSWVIRGQKILWIIAPYATHGLCTPTMCIPIAGHAVT